MAKQPRRTGPRVATRKAARPASKGSTPASAKARTRPSTPARERSGARPAARRTPPAAAVAPATRPLRGGAEASAPSPDRNLAVETFERGFRALQQRQFGRAAELLTEVVTAYPDEKELHERARVYLAVCARQAVVRDATPKTFDERVYAATLSINRGAYDEALALLTALTRDHANNEHVQYMLAVAHAQRGDAAAAVSHLRRAIELKPSNRYRAGQDTDLETLRSDPAFLALLEAPGPRVNPVDRERSGR